MQNGPNNRRNCLQKGHLQATQNSEITSREARASVSLSTETSQRDGGSPVQRYRAFAQAKEDEWWGPWRDSAETALEEVAHLRELAEAGGTYKDFDLWHNDINRLRKRAGTQLEGSEPTGRHETRGGGQRQRTKKARIERGSRARQAHTEITALCADGDLAATTFLFGLNSISNKRYRKSRGAVRP